MKSATWKTSEVSRSFLAFASDIKISHSVFALPFAASAIFLFDVPFPDLRQTLWLVIAMVGARSFAMGFNRYVDRVLDSGNPRTKQRAIPSGRLSSEMALLWTWAAAGILIIAAFALNPLAGYCSFPLLVLLAFYSYWKRFSWACHWYLGLCLGLAPVAVCVALAGSIPVGAVVLGLAITCWTGGFDILYALQDTTFDQQSGLKSIPTRFGVRSSILISQVSFGLMVVGLVAVGVLTGSGILYFVGVGGIAGFLTYEHYLIREVGQQQERKTLTIKIDKAFFNQNAYVSIFYLLAVIADWALV